METIDKETVRKLYERYRKNRAGIRNEPHMASICLICESIHIVPKAGDPHMLVCRNCNFAFYRYTCGVCGKTVDGRDPQNPACHECGLRICTCGACGCPKNESL